MAGWTGGLTAATTASDWEREFLKLAGMFLTARFHLLGGEVEDFPGKMDDCGCYCGMVDGAYEMKLMVKEKHAELERVRKTMP